MLGQIQLEKDPRISPHIIIFYIQHFPKNIPLNHCGFRYLNFFHLDFFQNETLSVREELNEGNEIDSPGMANDRSIIDDSAYTDESPLTK